MPPFVTLTFASVVPPAVPKPGALESYERAGVDRVVYELPDSDSDTVLRALDDLAALRS